jgi:hypothetical protein
MKNDIQQMSDDVIGKEQCIKGAERILPREYQREKDPRSLTKRSFDAWQERLKKEEEEKRRKQGKGF